jgi:hypothetical protein
VTTFSTADKDRERPVVQPDAAPVPRRVPTVPRQRNSVLGLLLASVALAMFVFVFVLAVLFHYAEAHHLLAKF